LAISFSMRIGKTIELRTSVIWRRPYIINPSKLDGIARELVHTSRTNDAVIFLVHRTSKARAASSVSSLLRLSSSAGRMSSTALRPACLYITSKAAG